MLEVEFCGEIREVRVGEVLSFGRQADLVIDDNPYLHRVLGVLSFRSGLWWLRNAGSALVIDFADHATASITTIRPGAETAIHVPSAVVRFSAGRSSYELELSIDEVSLEPIAVPSVDGAETVSLAKLPLTDDQRRLILALAEPALRDPFAREIRIPSNRQAADRLGWTLTRFNRKLDNVCDKLTKQGVGDLHGDVGELATDRRRRLVEVAVFSGLVEQSDLHLLDGPP